MQYNWCHFAARGVKWCHLALNCTNNRHIAVKFQSTVKVRTDFQDLYVSKMTKYKPKNIFFNQTGLLCECQGIGPLFKWVYAPWD